MMVMFPLYKWLLNKAPAIRVTLVDPMPTFASAEVASLLQAAARSEFPRAAAGFDHGFNNDDLS